MRKLLGMALIVTLAGCNTAGDAVQMGKNEFRIRFWGPPDNGPIQAQAYCRTHGYSYAEVMIARVDEVLFFWALRGF